MTLSARGQLADLRPITRDRVGIDPVASIDPWHIPSDVRLEDGCLVASVTPAWRPVRSPKRMLESFLRLSDASDERIAAYCKRYGVLVVCDEHLLPSSHIGLFVGGPSIGSYWTCRPLATSTRKAYVAPLSLIRYWSGQAFAILRIAAGLNDGRPGDKDDWRAISQVGLDEWWKKARPEMMGSPFLLQAMGTKGLRFGGYGEPLTSVPEEWDELPARSARHAGRVITAERESLALALATWIRAARVTLGYDWQDDRPAVKLTGGGMFGAIGIHLMLMCGASDGLAICSGCGRPYAPHRRTPSNRRHYCADCGKRAAIRDAARAYRQREKDRIATPPRRRLSAKARKR
jgi:hypothetical protein